MPIIIIIAVGRFHAPFEWPNDRMLTIDQQPHRETVEIRGDSRFHNALLQHHPRCNHPGGLLHGVFVHTRLYRSEVRWRFIGPFSTERPPNMMVMIMTTGPGSLSCETNCRSMCSDRMWLLQRWPLTITGCKQANSKYFVVTVPPTIGSTAASGQHNGGIIAVMIARYISVQSVKVGRPRAIAKWGKELTGRGTVGWHLFFAFRKMVVFSWILEWHRCAGPTDHDALGGCESRVRFFFANHEKALLLQALRFRRCKKMKVIHWIEVLLFWRPLAVIWRNIRNKIGWAMIWGLSIVDSLWSKRITKYLMNRI